MATEDDTLEEALTRLHGYGPEFEGFLSNHGPMVVEAMSRRHRADAIERWTDGYVARLEAAPRGRVIPTDEWSEARGKIDQVGDWIVTATAELAERPWTDVLADWWPWLLPGIAAGATHGVIRVGHAVRALRASADGTRDGLRAEPPSPGRTAELAHALGYWAARWRPVPIVTPPGAGTAAQLLPVLPAIADQSGGFVHRAEQLADTRGLSDAAAELAAATDIPRALEQVVDAVVAGYPDWASGSPTMLVHAATAPNAVLATLPSLPQRLWPDSFAAAWSAAAAVVAAYRPLAGSPSPPSPASDPFDDAVVHGSEHMIKFADTALASHARTGDPVALRAIAQAVALGA